MPSFDFPRIGPVIRRVNAEIDVLVDEGVLLRPDDPAAFTMVERQEQIALLQEVGASPEAINSIRFAPAQFDPVLPTRCAGGGLLSPGEAFANSEFAMRQSANLDFSCPPPKTKSGIPAIGEDFQNAFDSVEAEINRDFARVEAQINRTDEEAAELRDEAREGLGSLLSSLPGGRFLKFIFFAFIAIIVLVVLRLLFGLFRG